MFGRTTKKMKRERRVRKCAKELFFAGRILFVAFLSVQRIMTDGVPTQVVENIRKALTTI